MLVGSIDVNSLSASQHSAPDTARPASAAAVTCTWLCTGHLARTTARLCTPTSTALLHTHQQCICAGPCCICPLAPLTAASIVARRRGRGRRTRDGAVDGLARAAALRVADVLDDCRLLIHVAHLVLHRVRQVQHLRAAAARRRNASVSCSMPALHSSDTEQATACSRAYRTSQAHPRFGGGCSTHNA